MVATLRQPGRVVAALPQLGSEPQPLSKLPALCAGSTGVIWPDDRAPRDRCRAGSCTGLAGLHTDGLVHQARHACTRHVPGEQHAHSLKQALLVHSACGAYRQGGGVRVEPGCHCHQPHRQSDMYGDARSMA